MTRMSKSANTQKRKPPKSAWKPGVSGNPSGRPKEGQSWASTIKRITDMARDELIEYVGGAKSYYGQMLKRLPSDLPVKEMVVLSAVIQQIFDPNPKLFTAVTDREEGKPNQPVSTNVNLTWSSFIGDDGNPDAETDNTESE